MNKKVVKTMLITVAINLAVGTLLVIPAITTGGSRDSLGWALTALFVIGGGLLIQLITGIALSAGKEKKQTGQGILLAVGVILVIGLAVCSTIVFAG
jgi:hypothetical protein